MSRVAEQFDKARQYLAGGVSSSTRVNQALGHPLYFDRGEGCRLWDLFFVFLGIEKLKYGQIPLPPFLQAVHRGIGIRPYNEPGIWIYSPNRKRQGGCIWPRLQPLG